MKHALPSALLPLVPRRFLLTASSMVVGAILAATAPTVFVEIGAATGETPGRLVGVFEGVPMIIALVLVHGLVPRFPQWDRFGTSKTRTVAVLVALAAPLVSGAYFLGVLALYPAWGEPPAAALRPVINNVTIAALLAVVLLGLLGRLLGVVMWVGVVYAFLWAPTRWLSVERWSPLNLTQTSAGELDLGFRWAWLTCLTVLALATAWHRRLVPFELAIRPPEERQ